MSSASPRLWDGLDPVEPGPQPSRPTPAFGAPDIGQRLVTCKEDPVPSDSGDHSINGGYGHRPIPAPPQNPPAE